MPFGAIAVVAATSMAGYVWYACAIAAAVVGAVIPHYRTRDR
ncbi:MAG TPA: hypothetical protein VH143_02065 [Kofleriaceae bacterium]|nr:hypothetical protein [Kofleriaceae bacterium]